MILRKATLVFFSVLALVAVSSASLDAGELLTYKRRLPVSRLTSDVCKWKSLNSLTMEVPGKGSVVVTATGMAWFRTNDYPSLTLTLAMEAAKEGPWVYTLTPGEQPFQSFSVNMAFKASGKKKMTFYLNGASCAGGGGNIEIQTGVLMAEFFPEANVQLQADGVKKQERPAGSDLRSNSH